MPPIRHVVVGSLLALSIDAALAHVYTVPPTFFHVADWPS